jgi:hypothetical protein
LWADAICINQSDEVEKSAQIPMMGTIFANADRVRVWLGNDSEISMKAVQDVAWRDASTEPFESADAQLFRSFFGLPWFGRRWVVQEVVCNTDVVFYCGVRKMSWTSLNNIYQRIPQSLWVDNKQEDVLETLSELGHLWLRACYTKRYGREVNLWDLLQGLSHLQCADNKDRVYALAGLADDVRLISEWGLEAGDQDPPTFTLTSDYGCSDANLFASVTSPRLQISTLLYCTLAYAGAHRPLRGKRRFASWIPDFSLPRLWAANVTLDRTYLGPSTFIKEPDGSLRLTIQTLSWDDASGIRSDEWRPNRVEHLFPNTMSSEPQAAIDDLIAIEVWLESELKDTDHSARAFLQTLVTGIMPQIHWRGEGMLHGNEVERLAIAASKVHILRDSSLREGEELPIAFMSQFFAEVAGRRLFVSDRLGYRVRRNTYPPSTTSSTTRQIGFGPADMQVGDQFIASSACGKALFFREVEGGHELLGGGYSRLPVTGTEAPPRREVTFHIV